MEQTSESHCAKQILHSVSKIVSLKLCPKSQSLFLWSFLIACSRVAEKGLVRCLTPLNSDLTSLHCTLDTARHAAYPAQYTLLHSSAHCTVHTAAQYCSTHCCTLHSTHCCTVHTAFYIFPAVHSTTECALLSEEWPAHKLCIKTTFDRHSWRVPRCNPIQPKPLLLNSGQIIFFALQAHTRILVNCNQEQFLNFFIVAFLELAF